MSASIQLITDVQAAITTGPTAASQALANAAAGPIQDIQGNLNSALLSLKEARVKLLSVVSVLDGSDGIKTTLQNVDLSLV